MPAPGRYSWDQSTGVLTGIDESNQGEQSTLYELSGGKSYTQGAQIVYSDNPFQRFTQGSSGDAYFTLFRNGQVAAESQLQSGRDKLGSQETALYGVAGDLNVVLPNGEERQITIDQSLMAGVGERLMTYTDAAGIDHWELVTPGTDQDQTLAQEYTVTYREATSQEAQEFAVMGWINRHEEELVREFGGEGQGETESERQQARYDAIRALAQLAAGQLTFTKVHYVQGG